MAAQVPLPVPSEAVKNRTKPLVLVFETDGQVRESLLKMLAAEGMEASFLGQGENLTSGVQEMRPDAILLGPVVSGWNDWEALVELKNNPSTAACPVVALVDEERMQAGLTLGAAACLVRPSSVPEIVVSLRTVLAATNGSEVMAPLQ